MRRKKPILDRIIGAISPGWQLKREQARTVMARANRLHPRNHTGFERFSGTQRGGYDAGKIDRQYGDKASLLSENGVARGQLKELRARSAQLYRNNPHARKIVRTLQSKVIGPGLTPVPQATEPGGDPHEGFRQRAVEIFNEVSAEIDYRGFPGFGGQNFTSLQKTALKQVVINGSTFAQLRNLTSRETNRRGLSVPFNLQLVSRERLDEGMFDTKDVFHGIELDANGRRKQYWFLDYHPSDPRNYGVSSSAYDARNIVHLFIEEDEDQLDGTPWFAPALLQMRNLDDYEYHELTAAAINSCVALVYIPGSGMGEFSINPNPDQDLTDSEGNTVSHLEPGMILTGTPDSDIKSFTPTRPSTHVAEFSEHLKRAQATGLPGVKGTTLTQNYKGSSFSSERSADNDIWPELEGLQRWFGSNFMQPIYQRIIDQAVVVGKFRNVEGFDERDYTARKKEYLKCHWQGPVARSINPKDDAEAAALRIRNGQSSPQIEAAAIGHDAIAMLKDTREYIDAGEKLGIPEDLILQSLGIMQQDAAEGNANSQDDSAGGATETENDSAS